uniref:Replisome organizer protein n=1 Tax=Siphoviridae sp. ctYcY12 TaxID=2825550 RepID=A0A8S5TTY5_9CAUD|nr:MAG TPA: replisome organizer protein [Siphoviridae sp. ctYcY12]
MRESVVFYRSFYEAIRRLPAEQFKASALAILEYGLDGKEPETDGIERTVFCMAKPQIDANNRRYENGTKGGRPKTKNNQTETKDNINETKPEPKEKEKVKDNVKEKDNTYSCAFEALWAAYPRKKEKANAYKCYKARLADGFSEDELMTAVKRYADECKARRTEARYIKLGATFLSSNTPFADYLGDYKPEDTGQGGPVKSFNNFDHRRYSEDMLAALQDN